MGGQKTGRQPGRPRAAGKRRKSLFMNLSSFPPATPARPQALWRVHLQLLLMAVLWGATWSWGRVLAGSMPPLTAAAWRCVAASAALLWWMRRAGRLRAMLALPGRQWVRLAAAAALGVFGYAAGFMSGLRLIPASRAAVITTLTPALTLLCGALLFGERLNGLIALGMALAVGGAAFAISHGQPLQLLDGGLGRGEWLILGCVVLWAGYTLAGRAVLTGMDAYTTATATTALGGLMLLAASLAVDGVAGWRTAWHAPAQGWAALLALALLGTAVAYSLYFGGVKALGAGGAAAYLTLVPVFGMGLAALWLGEPVHISLATGGAVAVLGMALMHWGRRQDH